jgi:hypothetical protein
MTAPPPPESVELLNFLYRISGQHTLSGQHNFPGDKDRHTAAAAQAWRKTPAIFGKDWGFAREGDKDSAYIRNEIVEELKALYRNGALVTMCWHEVPPTADEPVTFMRRPGGGATTTNLNTVQGQLTEAQYQEKIRNLLWVWSVDRPEGTSLAFEECWPGPEYVDVLSLDSYRELKPSYYEDLLRLANGKPIAIGAIRTASGLPAEPPPPRTP